MRLGIYAVVLALALPGLAALAQDDYKMEVVVEGMT